MYFFFGSNKIIRFTNWLHTYKVSILKKQVVTLINSFVGISMTNYEISFLKFLTNTWAPSFPQKLTFMSLNNTFPENANQMKIKLTSRIWIFWSQERRWRQKSVKRYKKVRASIMCRHTFILLSFHCRLTKITKL